MRVIVVGPASDRARLRERLAARGIDVVAEYRTMAAARASAVEADAFVVAPDEDGRAGRADNDADRTIAESLTPRETEVLDLLARGLANKAIAARLGISDQTVKFHVSSICGKLGAANRTDAVRLGVRRGLISL